MIDIAAYLATSAAAAASLTARPGAAAVERAARLVGEALAAGGQVLFCGNGGSAADAQHLTAVGNDYGYAEVFARQVEGLGRPGDVLVAITTSGRSENVLRAGAVAKDRGLEVVALLGPSRSPLDELADVALHVDAQSPNVVQQGHITIGHALCGWVEAYLASRT